LLRRGRKIKEKDEHWQQQRGLTMSAMIILTAQAAQVRGPSVEAPKFAALDRIALTDGRFILGLEVLADPLHAEDLAFLSTLPQADVSTVVSLLPVFVGV
jgi:hypothetical protein